MDMIDKKRFFESHVMEYSRPVVLECGHEVCSSVKAEDYFEDKKRQYLPLHYIYMGKGKVHYRGKVYEVSKGDFFLVPPVEAVRYEADENEPCAYYWVIIAGQAAYDMLEDIGLNRDNIIASFPRKDHAVVDAFNILNEKHLSSPDDKYGALGLFYQLWSAISQKFSAGKKQLSSSYIHFRKAFLLIGCTYMNPQFTISDLCQNLNISTSYLNRVFKKEFDMTPMQYLSFIRIKNACDLISQTEYSFRKIAQMTGFMDSRYFAKGFKKHTTYTPTAYREKYRRRDEAEIFLEEKTMNKFIHAKKGAAKKKDEE